MKIFGKKKEDGEKKKAVFCQRLSPVRKDKKKEKEKKSRPKKQKQQKFSRKLFRRRRLQKICIYRIIQ